MQKKKLSPTSGHYDQIAKIEEFRQQERRRLMVGNRLRRTERQAFDAALSTRPATVRKSPAGRH